MLKVNTNSSIDNILYYDYMSMQEKKKNESEEQKNNIETKQTTITP